MKSIHILILVLFLTGCAVATDTSYQATPSTHQVVAVGNKNLEGSRQKALSRIDDIAMDMSISEVQQIMGSEVVVGYSFNQDQGTYESITVPAPYKTQQIEETDGTYDIFFYFTHIQREDQIVADDELMPLIFQEDKLIAKGWDAFLHYKIPL